MQISYVITVYNKAPYLTDVIKSLKHEWETPPGKIEYIFVDDGSTDDSIAKLKSLVKGLPGPFKIIEQQNMGAAYATNVGVEAAQYEWIRLVDGDDIVCTNSTCAMYDAAQKADVPFVLGGYDFFDLGRTLTPQILKTSNIFDVLTQEESLLRFIKNFPFNSSGMLITKDLFTRMGGSDIRLMSPDYSMALRAVVHIPEIAIMRDNVAQMPRFVADRLSGQKGRSRYESILVLYYLAFELLPVREDIAKAVYKRACSRSFTYAKALRNNPVYHGWRYLMSKFFTPKDLKTAITKCLSAYTPDGKIERPEKWKPGTVREK